jgi:hypothetical protein
MRQKVAYEVTFQLSNVLLLVRKRLMNTRVFNDLIDDFTKWEFKSFWDDFAIFKIISKYGDLI